MVIKEKTCEVTPRLLVLTHCRVGVSLADGRMDMKLLKVVLLVNISLVDITSDLETI